LYLTHTIGKFIGLFFIKTTAKSVATRNGSGTAAKSDKHVRRK